jgi:hypothetical protein
LNDRDAHHAMLALPFIFRNGIKRKGQGIEPRPFLHPP